MDWTRIKHRQACPASSGTSPLSAHIEDGIGSADSAALHYHPIGGRTGPGVQEWGGASNFMSLTHRRAGLTSCERAVDKDAPVLKFLVVLNCPEVIPIVVSNPSLPQWLNFERIFFLWSRELKA